MTAGSGHLGRRIEIAGVAGAGKSTLLERLAALGDDWLVADSLHARRPAHLPYLAAGLPAVLPLAAAAARRSAPPTWQDVKEAVYVSVWYRDLAAHADADGRTVLLDQGPIFALARLRWQPSPLTLAPGFRDWWQRAIERWAGELDGVVWLDAPDAVLVNRINGRARNHLVQSRPRPEALVFLDASRSALAAVIDAVRAIGVPVLSVDTEASTSHQAGLRVAAWATANAGALR